MLLFSCAASSPAGTLVHFLTYFGDMEVELLDQDKPATVSNFLRYVQQGRYTNTFFHRCDPDFVVQGGGYVVALDLTGNPRIYSIPTNAPVRNEAGVGAFYPNTYGTLAMAKLAGDTNSANSQFFFNLANNTFLDAHDSNNFFTVFGRVRRGTNVLESFKTFSVTNTTTNLIADLRGAFGPAFGEVPLYTSSGSLMDLMFMDISLMPLEIVRSNSQAQVSWPSVINRTNIVEYTTQWPPAWRTLVKTNGTGSNITVLDPISSGPTNRYYRVRVLY